MAGVICLLRPGTGLFALVVTRVPGDGE